MNRSTDEENENIQTIRKMCVHKHKSTNTKMAPQFSAKTSLGSLPNAAES